ncbi:terminase small subunit protein [Casimicrobium huifangae]|uniref:terminase small subunit-like protein n=1 Tax=Casimicrobium huifangae TaxID=2591109 RepID=UPI003784B73C
MGRPSDYTEDMAIEICARLASGESLVRMCKADDMPSVSTVYRWIQAHEEFRDNYTRAREDQADTLADEILDIANTPVVGVKTKTNEKGEVETTEGDMIEHRRLQVDARKWIAAKLKPKKYGDKQQTEVTGADGGPLQITEVAWNVVKPSA